MLPVAVFAGVVLRADPHLVRRRSSSVLLRSRSRSGGCGHPATARSRGVGAGADRAGCGIAVGVRWSLLWIPPVIQELRGRRRQPHDHLELLHQPARVADRAARGRRSSCSSTSTRGDCFAQQDATSGSGRPRVCCFGAGVVRRRGARAACAQAREWVAGAPRRRARARAGARHALDRGIFGFVWYYLMLWAWSLTVLMLLTIVWTATLVVRERRADDRAPRPRHAGAGRRGDGRRDRRRLGDRVQQSTRTGCTSPRSGSRGCSPRSAPPTVRALESGPGRPAAGKNGHYLVTFTDTVNIGAPFYGLILELERQGFDVGCHERLPRDRRAAPGHAHREGDGHRALRARSRTSRCGASGPGTRRSRTSICAPRSSGRSTRGCGRRSSRSSSGSGSTTSCRSSTRTSSS